MTDQFNRSVRKSEIWADLPLSDHDFANLGGDQMAYVRCLNKDAAEELFPGVEDIDIGPQLYSLHAADGAPIVLTDSHHDAIESAQLNDLEIVSLH